jgi:hypothetical protein
MATGRSNEQRVMIRGVITREKRRREALEVCLILPVFVALVLAAWFVSSET